MKRLLITCVALVLMATPALAVTVIDHFEEGAVIVTRSTVGTSTSTQSPLATVLGGERYMELTVLSANPPSEAQAEVFFAPGVDKLVYTNGSAVLSTLELVYGNTTPLAVDLSGDSFFAVRVVQNDHDVTTHVTLTDSDSSSTVSDSVPPSAAALVTFPFASFSGIDFSDIQKISVLLEGPEALDMEIHSFETGIVPEPATLLLLGLGAVPFIRKLRRS